MPVVQYISHNTRGTPQWQEEEEEEEEEEEDDDEEEEDDDDDNQYYDELNYQGENLVDTKNEIR